MQTMKLDNQTSAPQVGNRVKEKVTFIKPMRTKPYKLGNSYLQRCYLFKKIVK